MTKPQQDGSGKEANASRAGAGPSGKSDGAGPVITHLTDDSSPPFVVS